MIARDSIGLSISLQLAVNGFPVLDQFSEESFVDCAFKIESLREIAECFELRILASFENAAVGFDVQNVKSLDAGFDANARRVIFTETAPTSSASVATYSVQVRRACVYRNDPAVPPFTA